MSCNKLTKPETVDLDQCRKCKHASEKKIWCCLFGFYFDKPLISAPSKKLIKPPTKVQKPSPLILSNQARGQKRPKPTMFQMAESFAKAMFKWGKSGLKCVDKTEYIRRRTICSECIDGWRCPKCGCALWAKVALVTEECEKW